MPEISEITRVVHYINRYLAGKVIKNVVANEDAIVFKDTTSSAFVKAMLGRKIVEAKQQGKYFWIEMDSPPHPVMHFGMTGWITFSKAPEAHYRADMAEEDDDKEEIEWPPRFMKFVFEMEDEGNNAAFTDARRLGRVRLINVPAEQIRKVSPLKENGPDPVVDGLDEDWFRGVLNQRKKPVKALLLDQGFISGVGNWVGDEILYHARIHPEQYSNTLSKAQQKQLYESTMYVCKTACELLGDSSKFPEDWLFKYRWGKGKKGNALPNGEKIDFVKVGGRTSAYVKTRQKATGGTAVKEEARGSDEDSGEVKKSAKKRKAIKNEEDETPVKKGKRGTKPKTEDEVKTPAKRGRKKVVKVEESQSEEEEENGEEEEEEESEVEVKISRKGKSKVKEEKVVDGSTGTPAGRRSSRLKK
ncbi:hypothetical protein TWF102_003293 [Orbilia oligospora]|uniref:Formamidopyrimidine-DNA glycosylase catalytic domain-containing protein n=1 Tax=Orbilia oligospora TaxID=2813651 RepID=A0A7C8NM89_ORBOL|nr:hypothetical protein TWF102_003293 [Orbilia oligospora]KAF3081003.1 hypothetical protein TWF706_002409 [Orbilia oligospora]KAF3112403.1 hypothetical protein TWF103_003187 [Orbilia oligospora]KAF3119857.1 hypothetical protein TWF703_002999 [Orbilia oligospora]KAF3123117.1 hypothetical protein TWF594_002528 [Orbilia oligospora]